MQLLSLTLSSHKGLASNVSSDRFRVANGLQFNSLSFSGNDILSEQVLATLDGVNTKQLTEVNFRTL